ncbi:MAG TPA: hypothetical protein VF746_13785 [Longimicrobium sp.]|jgi:hypothetical protein
MQDMRQHLKIAGWLNIVNGALAIGIAVLVATLMSGAGILAAAEEGAGIFALMAGLGWFIVIFIGILAVPSIIGGWGLLNHRPWARILTLIVSFLNLFNFPQGTLIGAYSIWVLLDERSRLLLESGGRRQIAPY